MSLDDQPDKARPIATCCLYRRKIVVGIVAVLPEEQCGVSDSELADLLKFDVQIPTKKPVLAFRFCPWCGKPFTSGSEFRVTDSRVVEEDDGGE